MNHRGQIAIFLFILTCTLTTLLLWGRLRRTEKWFKVPTQDCPLYLPSTSQHVKRLCNEHIGGKCTGTDLQEYASQKWPRYCGTLSTKRQNNFTQGAIRPVSGTDNGFADTSPAVDPFLDYFND